MYGKYVSTLYLIVTTSGFFLEVVKFRTALILYGIDPTRCWKHSSEILLKWKHYAVAADLSVANPW